eukprot:TRINITY_DN30360_c0_g1_i1.p1 TRINITY_DN30360_c0_g1~~TRINITY_DN30360_c0_g1_i1.p1  ORF type:complete len:278 (+),score=61.04 TRINITY_DN30360_c0_g1_i1:33-866(+)
MGAAAGRCSDALIDAVLAVRVGRTVPQNGDVRVVDAATGGAATLPRAQLAPQRGGTRIVCVSDLHEEWRRVAVPAGDILVVAGDILRWGRRFTQCGGERKLADFSAWCHAQPVRDVVVIAGNHDLPLERLSNEKAQALLEGGSRDGPRITYLRDSTAMVQGLRFYGTPLSKGKSKNSAFQTPRCDPAAFLDLDVPSDIDVLLTHQPGFGGLAPLLSKVAPRLHVGGHAHSGYGAQYVAGVLSVTASTCDVHYKPVNPPIVVDVSRDRSFPSFADPHP